MHHLSFFCFLYLFCAYFITIVFFFSFLVLQGFAIPKEAQTKVVEFSFRRTPAQLRHGDVVIAAITSCTNTSNPSVMLGAALVAKKACELGLEVSCLFPTSNSVFIVSYNHK